MADVRRWLVPRTLLGRLALMTGLMLAIAVGALLWQESSRTRAQIEAGEQARIAAIAGTLALALDGTQHRRAAAASLTPWDSWEAAPPSVSGEHTRLAAAAERNRLATGISTLSLVPSVVDRIRTAPEQPVTDALRIIASSEPVPKRSLLTDYEPEMAPALLRGEIASRGAYRDEYGTWISAWAPIVTEAGQVVGVVEVEASLDSLLEDARTHVGRQILFAFLVLIIMVTAMVWVSARLTRNLTELRLAARRFGSGDLVTPIESHPRASADVRQLAETLEGAQREIAKRIEAQSLTEAELEAAAERAEELAHVKSRFLANMSHELRTPLNAILGYTEMLLEDAPADTAEDLRRIHTAGAHLLEMIGDVLDLAKLEAGKMDLVREVLDVGDVLQSAADTVHPLMAKGGNRLEIVRPAQPFTLRGDGQRIRQVLLNLLGNAAKFTENGTVTLEAERQGSGDAARVVFRVRDTGIGMSAEHLDRLFRPFTQADATTTRKYGGTGLGLSLSRELVVRMGGRIYAESREGEGSTFIVDLPLVG